MSNIEITLEGGGIIDTFHNDWDVCEARGLLHIENLEGWYGGVGSSVTPDLNRFRRHGKFPGRAIRSARKMDLTLTWVKSITGEADGAYMGAARLASGIAWDEGPYEMTVNEDGRKLSTLVQLDGEPAFQPIIPGSEDAFRIRIPLRASDPFLYSPEWQVPIYAHGRSPVILPNAWGQGMLDKDGRQVLAWSTPIRSVAPLSNSGTADAYPTIRVVANSPSGVNVVINGGTVQYAAPLFEQSPLTLDYRKGSATVNGRDASFNLRKREWKPIKPHQTAVPRMTFPGTGGTGFATAIMRSTWI